MNIFIDENCKCHVSNPNGTYTGIELPKQLEGKCSAYVEGFRVRPNGFTYVREDGKVFGPDGESVSPWRNLALLDEFQAQYEEAEAAQLEELGALVEEIYTNDLEVIG